MSEGARYSLAGVADSQGEADIGYEGWRVAGAASVGVFVSFASLLVYTFGVLLKPLAEEFAWSRESVSVAFGIAAITVAVCSPPLGYLFDRVKPTRIIVPCLILFGAAFASLSLLTPRLWHLYAIFFVLGVVGRHGSDGVLASGVELVRETPRDCARHRDVWRRGRCHRASTGGGGAHPSGRLAAGLRCPRCARRRSRRPDRGALHS